MSRDLMPSAPVRDFDDVFVLRLRRREERAFNELVLALEGRVFRLIWRMLANEAEAEEMTQEVFVQVWKSVDTFRGESKLSTWVYRIAVNLTKNRTKYLQRRHQKSHGELDGTDPREAHNQARGLTVGETTRPDQTLIGNETERIVRAALSSLEDDFREVLVLRDIEGMTYEEIAVITAVPEGTVKSRLHRARNELKSLVEAQLGEKLS